MVDDTKIVKDARGNHNNLLLIGPEGGTTLAEEIPQQPKEQRAPMTAIDRVHSDNFEDDEDYEDAPLLSHEAPSLMTKDGLEVDPGQRGRRTSLGINISRVHTFVPPEPTHEDLKDPELEKFPENKSGILNRMHTLKHELPIDDSSHLDKNGNDPMAYHLSRSLADLKSKDTKQEVLFADFAKPKGTDKEDSESSRKSHQPFSSFFFWTDLTSGASGHLDGAVENAAIPLSQSPKPAEDALLRKPSSAEGSYGTIGPLFNGSESGASATARTKYASASALTVQNHLTNASIVDSHESVFTTVDEVSNDSRRDNRSNGISGGTPPWVDKVAVGVAMASICALLVGGWAFVSSRAHA